MAIVNAESVITALTVASGFALGIERSLELLKHFMNSGNGTLGVGEHKSSLEQTRQAVEKAEQAAKTGIQVAPRVTAVADSANQVVDQSVADSEAIERYPQPKIPVIKVTALSTVVTSRTLFFQMAAAGMGIIFAWVFDINLVKILSDANNIPASVTSNWIDAVYDLLGIVFTGLVIGGGSQPIHVLIRFLTERKIPAEGLDTDEVEKENEKVKDLAKVISTESLVEEKKEAHPLEWRNIVYLGGVKPESMDNNHRRTGDPNLIVYHHTAMSSASSFQAVVDEFLINKKWLTGYHCVIMPDGSIKPFCRWDRYGNHAKGLNIRSLGIAFHGNFHTDPSDKYSNADGRFGNQQPTEAQLHAGARVVALWVNIYKDINLDFEKAILPHKKAIPNHTVCPGSNFSYTKFELLTRQYHEAWADSDEAQAKIAEFKDPAITKYVYA